MESTEQAQAERLQWLAERQQGIGGSDAAALFGVNPWQSLLSLYESKVADTVDDEPDNTSQWLGRKLEGAVRDVYREKTGRVVGPGVRMARHPDLPFMIANTDGTIISAAEYDGEGVYEGKTTSIFNGREWDEGVPLYYQIQCQHYLAVTGLAYASVAVLVLGSRDPFKWKDVPRNDDFIEVLQEREHAFWHQHVLPRKPPSADGTKATAAAIAKLYPSDNGRVMILPPDAATWHRQRAKVQKAIGFLEKRKRELDNAIKAEIGSDSFGAVVNDDGEVTGGWSFRTKHRKEYTVPELEYRELRSASVKTIKGILHDQMRVKVED